MKNLITSSVFTHLNNSSSKNFRLKMFLITLLTNLTVISIITVVDVGIHGILFSGGNIVGFFNFLLQGIISSFFPIAIISFITISILIKPIYNVMKKNENGEDVSKEDSIKAIKRMVRIPRIILIIDIFIPVLISIVTTLLSAEDSNFIFLTLVKDISINLLLSAVQISLYQKAMSAPRAILKIYSIDRTEKEFFARHMSKIQVYASAVFIVSTMIYAEISLTQYISSSINPQGTVQNELLGKVKNNMNSGEKPPIIKNETPEALGKKSGLLILAVVLFTFPIVILANIIIDRSKDTQIKILKEILYSMSQGEADLTQRVLIVQGDTNGELSELLNNLLYKLQTMFKNVTSSANKVSESSAAIGNVLYKTVTATEEMVASVKQINSNADQFKHVVEGSQESLERTLDSLGKITENVSTQAAFVDQTSSSMEEMVANINSVNEVTAKANKLAEALQGISKKGGDAVSHSITAVKEIEVSSSEVSNIVTVIAKILAQTNILAMNAAIEAAHAGVAGKGFAVVAEEVRKLADNSSSNLQTISLNMKDVLEKVNNGVHLSEEAGSALLEVGEKTLQTTNLMNTVAAAMDEQVAGANEVLSSINSLVKSSSEIKNLSEEQQSNNKFMKDNLEKTVQAFTQVQMATKELEIGNNEILNGISELKEVIAQNEAVVEELQKELAGYKV